MHLSTVSSQRFTKMSQASRVSRYDSRQNFQLRPGKAPLMLNMNYDLGAEVQKSRMRAQQVLTVVNTLS